MKNKQKTINSYNVYAQKWADHMRSGHNHAHEYLEKPAMYGKLPVLKGLDVLCIGCGTGEECDHLDYLGANRVVGVDISEGLIEYAKKSYPRLEFQVMDMEYLDFQDESFDFIYSSLVMHYTDSSKPALAEAYRVLKKGGRFLFSTHHPATYAAARTRNKSDRSSVLGYKKYYDSNTCEVLGDYLNQYEIEDTWFEDFPVSYVHRPLSSTISDILESKFELVDFLEPKPIETVKEIDPVFWEIHSKIPKFMIFELLK